MVTLSLTSLGEIVIGASFLTALAIFSIRSSSSTTSSTTTTTTDGKGGKKKKKKAGPSQIQGNVIGLGNGVQEGVESVKRTVENGIKEVKKEIGGVEKGIEKIEEKVKVVEKAPLAKKKTKRVPLVMEDTPSPITPTPKPSIPSSSSAPSFAKIASPSASSLPSTKFSKALIPTKSNPLSDMRDLTVDPEDSSARVIKIVDSRPDINGSEEWREWSAANGDAREALYEDSGEVKEAEGSWEVAKKRLSHPCSLLGTALTD